MDETGVKKNFVALVEEFTTSFKGRFWIADLRNRRWLHNYKKNTKEQDYSFESACSTSAEIPFRWNNFESI